MTWFKVDDALAFHPKAIQAGNLALGLWVRAGSWSAQQLTDGYMPAGVVALLGSEEEATRLVGAGLWHPDDRGGWSFHDWSGDDGYQPTRAQVESERKANRDRQARWRERSRESRFANASANGVTNAAPDPTRPDRELTLTTRARDRLSRDGARNPEAVWRSMTDPDRASFLAAMDSNPSLQVVCGEHHLPLPCSGCAADAKAAP